MRKTEKFSVILLLVFGLLFASNFNQAEASNRFPDTKSNRDEILYLSDLGIINGYPDGTFGPNKSIKRVHAVQMILRELGVKTGDAPNPKFSDITPSSYGYAEIAKAKQLNIISGKGNKFDPNGSLKRGEMAKILVEAYKLKGAYYTDFKDVGKGHFSLPYVRTLAAHNISVGYDDGTFRPEGTLTRAHFSLFMARLLNDEFKPKNTKNLTTKQLATHSQSVVAIELFDEAGYIVSRGSGFITSNNLIATNLNIVSGGVSAIAITESGEKIKLDGVAQYDEYYDVALLKPAKKIGLPALPLARFSTVKEGESVISIGNPNGTSTKVTQGIVESKEILEGDFGDANFILTTAKFTIGSAGGPLINQKGFVIGLNYFDFMEYDTYFVIATDYLDDLVKNYRKVKFNDIKVEGFENMPVYEDWQEDWEEGTEW